MDETHGTNGYDFVVISVQVIDEFDEGFPVLGDTCGKVVLGDTCGRVVLGDTRGRVILGDTLGLFWVKLVGRSIWCIHTC